jgi:hypothetical protein
MNLKLSVIVYSMNVQMLLNKDCPCWQRQSSTTHVTQERMCLIKTKQFRQTHNASVALDTQHAMRVRHIVICGMSRF